MEPVRYKPGEAIRWIQTGAEKARKGAKERGKAMVHDGVPTDVRAVGKTMANAAGAIAELGKSAWADLMHLQAAASEYVFLETGFDIVKPGSIKSVPYERVQEITLKGDKATLRLDRGTLTVKPYAYILAGRIKVPVGWSRNGMEVPYELMLDELAARCGVNIQHL